MAGPHFALFWAVLVVGAYAGLLDARTARDPIGGMNSWGVNEGDIGMLCVRVPWHCQYVRVVLVRCEL
jgi:hypothetical protein